MKDIKDKGFTLIELISVLVILAIIAIIVTPLVLNIVRKAKDSANRRSVDAYGKSVELAVASYLLNTGDFPSSINDLKVDYKGLEVICKVVNINDDGSLYLSECTVGNDKVKDTSTEDGFYHYGKTKFYQEYKIGDEVTYNGINFHVIKDSNSSTKTITLLKSEPLTVDEINKYGTGHINNYTNGPTGKPSIWGNTEYGGMAYYSSETCGFVNGSRIETGCTTNYDQSDIKYVVDAWASDKFNGGDLEKDSLGYEARLITYEELVENLGYDKATWNGYYWESNKDVTPSWVFGKYCYYWTMSSVDNVNLYEIFPMGDIIASLVYSASDAVRPVVTLNKSAIE